MSETLKISVEPRTLTGSREGKRLRREGYFPGIVYGANKETEAVKVNEHEFHKGLGDHIGEHLLLDLDIKGKDTRKVILQEVQHDALTGRILHADFHEIDMTEKLSVEVRLELVGTPVGVTQSGGVLEHPVRTVEVECLPGDLLEEIKVDVSGLQIGDHLTVADIKLDPSKYEILTDPEVAIAGVAEPTKEIEAETPEEEAEEGAEGDEAAEGEEGAEGDEEEKKDEGESDTEKKSE